MADSRISFGTATNSTGRIVWRSNWNSISAYNVNDLVAWTGGVYIALAASTNILPSNMLYWDLVIASGSVTSVSGRTGSVVLLSSDLTDANAALGCPTLDASAFLKPAQFNEGVDAIVATTYAIVAADRGRIKTFSNASPIAVSIAQATGSFASGWFTTLQNTNAGVVTVTASVSLIEGNATVTLKQWESITLVSAGGNYICLRSKVRAAFTDITGTAAMTQGGTGVDLSAGGGTTMVLAQNASHVISARNLVAADIPSLPASQITSGALALARGGTAVDLSASGGTTAILAQDASHVISARNLVAADIPSLATVTETLKNKTLQGAASGNAVTLLNFQGGASAIVGNGAAQNIFTYTLPANTMAAGKGIRVKCWSQHATGSASVAYTVTFGGTIIQSWSSTSTASMYVEEMIFNNAGVTNAQTTGGYETDGNIQSQTVANTAAINTTAGVVINFTFNVANTDQVTPKLFVVELIQ